MPVEKQKKNLEDFLKGERGHRFNLMQAPLIRSAVIQLGDDHYQFVWNQHHLLSDGWSMSILLKEVFLIYEASIKGVDNIQLASSRPYRDYIAWLQQQDQEEARTYWQQALEGFTAPTPLSIGNMVSYKSSPPETFGDAQIILSKKMSEQLQIVARTHKLTVNTFLLGAWALLLSRYSGEKNILFGTSVSGRPETVSGSDSMIGLFINTIPVRVQIDPETSLLSWLNALQKQQAEAQQYNYSSLAKIQGWSELHPAVPLFESTFVYENYPSAIWMREQEAGISIQDVRFLERQNYALAIEAISIPELLLQVSYDEKRFTHVSIQRLLHHFQTLLEQMSLSTEKAIGELSLLTEIERKQYLFPSVKPDSYPEKTPIHALFEQQVHQTPDNVAVRFGMKQLTYEELNRRANQLAHHLQNLDVKPGALVGLCLTHSPETIIAILGILKVGAAYVPIDPKSPPMRADFILSDAKVELLITQKDLRSNFDLSVPILCLDSEWDIIAQSPNVNLSVPVVAEDTVYIIYTSGSTGQPKGVEIQHAALVSYTWWAKKVYAKYEPTNFALYSSLAFDLTVTSIYTPLLTGGTIIVHNVEGSELEVILNDNTTQVLKLTPSHLALVKERDNRGSCVDRLIVGGEALSTALAQEVWQSFGGEVTIYNEYGPTEATVGCMIHTFDPEVDRRTYVPIGLPADNVQLYVLNERRLPVADNVVGELYIAGPGLAKGYLGQEELTSRHFIQDSIIPGQKVYRTGDRVRRLPEGILEFIGRTDEQIKFHGHRVEIGEIIAALTNHSLIRNSVVTVTHDKQGNQIMVAYYVSRQEIAIEELRQFLAERLVEEIIPNVFVHLKRLPLTINGKVNYRGLPSLDEIKQNMQKTFVPPQTPVETIIADIWADVLGLERVGRFDNFFELGGDSILSIRIVAQANQMGLHLSPKQLFQYRTVAQLAAVATQEEISFSAEQGVVVGDIPLTPIQHWFWSQPKPNPHHYNQSTLLQVPATFNHVILEEVLSRLVEHHDSFGLRFFKVDNAVHQISTAERERVRVATFDLTSLPLGEQRNEINRSADRLQAELDLEKGPLLCVALFDLGLTKQLLIVMHHMVVDGVSWPIFLESLQIGYEQISQGKELRLPIKTTSFREWAIRLQQYAQSTVLQEELDYWLHPDRANVVCLPIDFEEVQNIEATARTIQVCLSHEETDTLLKKIPSIYHTQTDDVLLTTLAHTIAQWTNHSHVLIDLEGHGRESLFDDVDLSRTMGWFTSIFPVLLVVDSFDTPGKALCSIKEQLRAIPNRGIGYGLLRYLCQTDGIGETLSNLPSAQISFNYLGQIGQELVSSDLFAWAEAYSSTDHDPDGRRPYLLEVNSYVRSGQLHLDWLYSETIHKAATINGLAQDCLRNLRQLIHYCLKPGVGGYTPSDFPLANITQEQLDNLAQRFPNLEDIYPLAPTQQGMLFHALYDPDSTVYFIQFTWLAKGNIEVAKFKQAWQEIINRHPILRTSFLWEGIAEPLQLVHKEVELPWQQLDWQDLPQEEVAEQLQVFLMNDRQQGFDLSKVPLMRMACIKMAPETYQFVWSQHHITIDGWSLTRLLREAALLAESFSHNSHDVLPPMRPYRDYIAWLQQQSLTEAKAFWEKKLHNFNEATTIPGDKLNIGNEVIDYQEFRLHLSLEVTANLRAIVKQYQVTLNTIVQAAWAFLLAYYNDNQDVVYGTTVSGRPTIIPYVEAITGPFLNTLPVRIQVPTDESFTDWLQTIQEEQIALRDYEYISLGQVQRWSQMSSRSPLFHSVLVFENYAQHEDFAQYQVSGQILSMDSYIQNNFPFTIRIVPAKNIELHVLHNCQRFDLNTSQRIMKHFLLLLTSISHNPTTALKTLRNELTHIEKEEKSLEAKEREESNVQKLHQLKKRSSRRLL